MNQQQQIPGVEKVSGRLTLLTHAQLRELSERSGVPFGTLMKIRRRETTNPGIETVRSFWPILSEMIAAPKEALCER